MRLVCALLVCLSAASFGQEVRRALPVDAVAAPVVTPADPNSLANFLAGRPTEAFAAQQAGPEYASYAAQMSKLRGRYFSNYFEKMRAWSEAELRPRLEMGRPVFYFFGGPDALAANAYFPDAPVYILGGLEPVGSIASPAALTPAELAEALKNLEDSTETILSYGHFITKDMKAQFERTAFKGVLPIFSAFLALADKQILSVNYIGIRPDGTLTQMGASYTGGKGVLPGVCIQFRGAGGPMQTLYYVQANVADEALSSDGGLLRWSRSFGSGNVYLKAASYLMHETYFSTIRKFLLSNDAVLQDDSGIPFHFLLENGWRVFLFGRYNGTLDIFTKYYQKDLQTAFEAQAAPLPFGTGYKWRQGESNLELAIKPRAATR